MKKKLPHEAGMITYAYTAYSTHYQWQTTVRATSLKRARELGAREARLIFGNHARILRDHLERLDG